MKTEQLDAQYIAGTYARYPVVMDHGKGSLVYDEAGKEYIDLGSGIAVTSFGFADDAWQAAVTEQLGKLQHSSNLYYTKPAAQLAQTLCERTGMKKVFFSNSGAESNEAAVKVARKYAADKYGPERYTIVTLNDSFHGRTITTLSATGQDVFHKLFQPLTPGFAMIDAGDTAALQAIHEQTPVAGVLIELVQGEGGVHVLDPEWVAELQDYCAAQDIVFMIDEVQTGNGRTGELFAFQNYGLKPDVVSTAKGLAGGLPLGATMMNDKTQDVLGFGDHGSTFGGNPVCCAAAQSVVDRLDADFLAQVKAKSEYLMDALANMDGVTEVSGLGLMIGFRTEKPAVEVQQLCRDNGVLVLTAKDKVRLLPALNIPQELLERAVGVIAAACAS
ncbi:MAG: acetylornithine/succinylornithine family transaminase [Actinomycetaceae bacterium]|nr:acetylornithine/succinylornithine family transaminase [Actinomycetaceae bacterium]